MLVDLSKLKAGLEQENSNLRTRYGDLEEGHVLTDTMREKVFKEYISYSEFSSLKQSLSKQAGIKVFQAIK